MSYQNRLKNIDISSLNHDVGEYTQDYRACDQYAYDIHSGITPACQQVKNSVARYIYDRLCRDDLEFRTDEVDNVVSFANKLKHNKGKLAGKPVYLLNWMIFVLGNAFGWYCTTGDRKGERRFTKIFTLVARGNAKSFICSIVALYTMISSPNGMPSCYSAARTAKQASIVFKDAKLMLRSAEFEVKSLFVTQAHEIKSLLNDGSFSALASDSQSVDGLRVSLAILDELHAHHSSDMMNTLITGTSASVDPMIFAISTAGTQLDGVCIMERNLVRDINQDIEKFDDYFGIEFSLDEKDDWQDETVWYKANPSIGHSVNINTLRGEVIRARKSAANKKDFMTKYCNIFVNIQDSPYIDVSELQANCAREDLHISDYLGKECFIGLDLAQRFDLAALSILFPNDDGTMTAFQRHYCAYGALKKLTAGKHENYLQWEHDGHLILTDGESTDFEYIKDDIRHIAKHYDLQMVGYDPYAATQMALELERDGIDMVEVRQSYAQLSEPAKLFQVLIAESKFLYQASDKCFEWNASNSVCSHDKNDNIKVHKAIDKPHDKVDSIVALITGLNPESLKEPKKKNPYRKRGMIII